MFNYFHDTHPSSYYLWALASIIKTQFEFLQFEICGCIYLTVSAEILIFYNSVNLIP